MTIEEYLRGFERWIAGPKHVRAERRAELEAHLREAEAAGELTQTLERLGEPRAAAGAFADPSAFEGAPLTRRFLGAAVDYGILIGLLNVPSLVALVAGIVWFVVGLTAMEAWTGRTPGKWLAGTRVVSEDGKAPSLKQVMLRRLTLVFSGPLQLIDWAFLFTKAERPQRGIERLAHTFVADDRRARPAPAVATPPASPA